MSALCCPAALSCCFVVAGRRPSSILLDVHLDLCIFTIPCAACFSWGLQLPNACAAHGLELIFFVYLIQVAVTINNLMHHFWPGTKMEGWELDGNILPVARQFMGLQQLEDTGDLVRYTYWWHAKRYANFSFVRRRASFNCMHTFDVCASSRSWLMCWCCTVQRFATPVVYVLSVAWPDMCIMWLRAETLLFAINVSQQMSCCNMSAMITHLIQWQLWLALQCSKSLFGTADSSLSARHKAQTFWYLCHCSSSTSSSPSFAIFVRCFSCVVI